MLSGGLRRGGHLVPALGLVASVVCTPVAWGGYCGYATRDAESLKECLQQYSDEEPADARGSEILGKVRLCLNTAGETTGQMQTFQAQKCLSDIKPEGLRWGGALSAIRSYINHDLDIMSDEERTCSQERLNLEGSLVQAKFKLEGKPDGGQGSWSSCRTEVRKVLGLSEPETESLSN